MQLVEECDMEKIWFPLEGILNLILLIYISIDIYQGIFSSIIAILILYLFLFSIMIYVAAKQDSTALQSRNVSKELSRHFGIPLIIAFLISLILQPLSSLTGLFVFETARILLSGAVLWMLTLICPIIDASIAWGAVKDLTSDRQ